MILRGIMELSLGGFTTIRGYAPLGDLEKISFADESFQRNLIKTQEEDIVEFLENEKYLFFPEVILSYTLKYDYYKDNAKSGIKPLDAVLKGKSFVSNVDKIKFNSKLMSYGKRTPPVELKITAIEIDDQYLKNKKPFFRIDGNHRLSAAKVKSEFYFINTPFSLILFQDNDESKRFEKTIFHNINSKSIPLTSEENLRVVFDLFSVNELKQTPSYGWAYALAKSLYDRNEIVKYSNISKTFTNPTNKQYIEIRTVLVKLFLFLFEKNVIAVADKATEQISESLKEINLAYYNKPELSKNSNSGLLISFVYYYLKNKNLSLLESFNQWVVSNHIYEIKEVRAEYIVSIFDKIITSKERQIFVSMPFGTDCDNHYEAIEKTVSEINEKYMLDIKIVPLRIDKYLRGTSYKITDEILELIQTSGLLVADLTCNNPNVYHEVGYLMGLAKMKGLTKPNVILIIKKEKKNGKDITSTYFNLRDVKQLRFDDTIKLIPELKENILKFYNLK